MSVNPERGEADLAIGGVGLVIAVTFAGLAKLSRMVGTDDMDTLYRRLIGFEPWTASCALRVFAVHPEGREKAEADALRAVTKLSAADETDFRQAITFALTAHMEAGRKARGEPPLDEQVHEAAGATETAPGEPAGPEA